MQLLNEPILHGLKNGVEKILLNVICSRQKLCRVSPSPEPASRVFRHEASDGPRYARIEVSHKGCAITPGKMDWSMNVISFNSKGINEGFVACREFCKIAEDGLFEGPVVREPQLGVPASRCHE